MNTRTVIVAYRPKPGKTEALRALTETHLPRLRERGLVTDRGPILLEAANGVLIEIFEWLSPEAMIRAHNDPEVHKLWAEYAEVCDYVPLNQLPETASLFAEFTPLN